MSEAEKVYDKLLREKTSKGYTEGEKKNDFSEKQIPGIDTDHQFTNFGFHSDEWWKFIRPQCIQQ